MNFKKIQIISIIFVLFIQVNPVFAASDDINVTQQVTGCNNNGICESSLGENETTCPNDCGCNNNGICESQRGENSTNCLLDCPAGTVFLPDVTPPRIYNLSIGNITLNSAEISWETNELTFCQFFLGKTQEYEKESITETAFYLKHSTQLTQLSPATTYHFKIICKDTNRNNTEIENQKFITLSPPDITAPANVSNFEAIPGDSQITLRWQNPPDPDFQAVRIMRSEKFYPQNPWESFLIYDGKLISFIDSGLENGTRYYYTAFAYDKAGNFSSGAIASSVPQKFALPAIPTPPEQIPPEESPQIPPPEEMPPIIPLPPEESPPVVPLPPEIEKLKLEDFNFFQEDKKIPLEEGVKIRVETEKSFTISIDYEKVPQIAKMLTVTLEKDEKTSSFLLGINKEKTRYEAEIFPPEIGTYSFVINILDYKNQILKEIDGELIVEKVEPIGLVSIPWYKKYQLAFVLLGILAAAGIIYFLKKQKKK